MLLVGAAWQWPRKGFRNPEPTWPGTPRGGVGHTCEKPSPNLASPPCFPPTFLHTRIQKMSVNCRWAGPSTPLSYTPGSGSIHPWHPLPGMPPTSTGRERPPLVPLAAQKTKVTQSCPTLSDPIDYSLPGSSVHGILQARILEWVAVPFCR